MSQLRKLTPLGQEACRELAKASPWSAEEWARSVRFLLSVGLFPEPFGLRHVQEVSHRVGAPPLDVAQALAKQYAVEVRKQIGETLG